MREILFRGKIFDNEWVEGLLVWIDHNDETALIRVIGKDGVGYFDFLVDFETVGQFTGLTDKNGKKIFEGDIVRTHYANALKAVFVETVVFDGGKFCATSTNEGCKTTAALWDGVPRLAIDKSVYMDEVEVIGNIQDNPELLEVGE